MNATPTPAIIKEFAWAAEAIAEMQAAADLERYEKAWLDCLHYLDRGWNKLEKHLAGSQPKKSEPSSADSEIGCAVVVPDARA